VPVAHRLLASGLATSAAQWTLATASWLAMGFAPTTGWLAGSGVLTAAVTVLTYRLLVRPEPPAEERRWRASDDDPEPPWWPDFERAFRAHADRRAQRATEPA
jgi:hypothetical protein